MTSVAHSTGDLRLVLVSPCPAQGLAIATIVRHLGISHEEAARKVTQAPSTLAERMDARCAHRLVGLLQAMGAQVRTEKASDTPLPQVRGRADLSIQPVQDSGIDKIAVLIAAHFPIELAPRAFQNAGHIEAMLTRPGGLIVERLAETEIKAITRGMRKVPGLRITQSEPHAALYDILPGRIAARDLPKDLRAGLQCLGLAPCALTGAVAAGLDRTTRDLVVARFPGSGLIAMNRDFQLFDLFLTDARSLSPCELADFLATRSDLPREMVEELARPLRIETGLKRACALAFQADYADFGLETKVRMRLNYPIRCPNAERILP